MTRNLPPALSEHLCRLRIAELATGALKHAFQGRDEGRVRLRFHALSDDGVRLIVEDHDVRIPEAIDRPKDSRNLAAIKSHGMDQPETRSGAGSSPGRALTNSLGAGLIVMTSLQDTTVTTDLSRCVIAFRPRPA